MSARSLWGVGAFIVLLTAYPCRAASEADVVILRESILAGDTARIASWLDSHGMRVGDEFMPGRTPLHMAVCLVRPDVVDWMLGAGADPNTGPRTEHPLAAAVAPRSRDYQGGGAGLNASSSRANPYCTEPDALDAVVRLLVNGGVAVNGNVAQSDRRTALQYAAETGDCMGRAVAVLLEAGANPDGRFGLAPTPLHMASAHAPAVMRQLLAAGAHVNATNGAGLTPLHMVQTGRAGATLLLDAGADPRARAANGDTPLHTTVADDGVVAGLLAAGGDPQAKGNGGDTPLHRAVRGKHVPSAWALVQAGASPDAMNDAGETPIALAQREGLRDMLQMFSDAGLVVAPAASRSGALGDALQDAWTGATLGPVSAEDTEHYVVRVQSMAYRRGDPLPLGRDDRIVAVNGVRCLDPAEYGFVRYNPAGPDPSRLLVARGEGGLQIIEMARSTAAAEPIGVFAQHGHMNRIPQLWYAACRSAGVRERGWLLKTMPGRVYRALREAMLEMQEPAPWLVDVLRTCDHLLSPDQATGELRAAPHDVPVEEARRYRDFLRAVRENISDPARRFSPDAHGVDPRYFALYYPFPALAAPRIELGKIAVSDGAFATALALRFSGATDRGAADALAADYVARAAEEGDATQSFLLRCSAAMLKPESYGKATLHNPWSVVAYDAARRAEVLRGIALDARARPENRSLHLAGMAAIAYYTGDMVRADAALKALAMESPAMTVAAHGLCLIDDQHDKHANLSVDVRLAVATAYTGAHPVYTRLCETSPDLLRLLTENEDGRKPGRPESPLAPEVFAERLALELHRTPQCMLALVEQEAGR